jgi:hypothetical protein
MRRSTPLVLILLGPATLLAGDGPIPDEGPAPPEGPVAGASASEVTIDRQDQPIVGLGFGGPLGVQATIGLLHGLGADVKDEDGRVKAVCAAPISYCARGFLLEAGAGSGGGKLSLGLGGRVHVDEEDFHGAVGASLKVSVARTWGSPIGTDAGLTYLGPELDLSVLHVGASVGVLWRVSGRGGAAAVFSWGLWFQL